VEGRDKGDVREERERERERERMGGGCSQLSIMWNIGLWHYDILSLWVLLFETRNFI
jgi:hypothetical protein